jgi:3',5'-cyclic-AMP phosphodiesterase
VLNKQAHEYIVAQFSDCHLFADKNALFHGANVYQNLVSVLSALASDNSINAIVFTGDLSQDHSEQSYQNFVDAVNETNIVKPIYSLAGNHDQVELLNKYLVNKPFNSQNIIVTEHWQLLLLHSKSDTPAGLIEQPQLALIEQAIDLNKKQLLFTHHQPVNVGYFIDKHGLKNQVEFWQMVAKYPSIKALACGHVHRALNFTHKLNKHTVQIITCPASSIQFDPQANTVKALEKTAGQGIGYRRICLSAQGSITTKVHFCAQGN